MVGTAQKLQFYLFTGIMFKMSNSKAYIKTTKDTVNENERLKEQVKKMRYTF